MSAKGSFVVATNPDPHSKLPFLISVPLATGPIVLKAGDRWPKTAKVYCHRAEGWPEHPEVLEAVPVRSCVRRGQAIDLVLARARENRSQIVFTTIRGREGIFWQSPKTARQSRPAVRVPGRRASGLGRVEITVDTRERYPYRFARQRASTIRAALPSGDYGVEHDGAFVAVVERKAIEDLAKTLVDGSLMFAMAELSALRCAAVVVEAGYGALFKVAAGHVAPGYLADLLGALQARYPSVPVVFCETRPLAEEWTFRFLGGALSLARQDQSLDHLF